MDNEGKENSQFKQLYSNNNNNINRKQNLRNVTNSNNQKNNQNLIVKDYNTPNIKSELSFANDYVKTLKIWLQNFDQNHHEIRRLGFSEEFIRKWRFYLAYCIAGFSVERTSVVQFELIKKQ